jgi:hypothetical protein
LFLNPDNNRHQFRHRMTMTKNTLKIFKISLQNIKLISILKVEHFFGRTGPP